MFFSFLRLPHVFFFFAIVKLVQGADIDADPEQATIALL